MTQKSGRINRRQFSKLLGGSLFAVPWVVQQSAKAQTREAGPKGKPLEARWTESQKREAQKALEALEKETQTLAKFDVSVAGEPAFVFRARPVASRRPRVRAAGER